LAQWKISCNRNHYKITFVSSPSLHTCTWGANKSLVRPGKKQATATKDSEFHTGVLISP